MMPAVTGQHGAEPYFVILGVLTLIALAWLFLHYLGPPPGRRGPGRRR